MVSTSTSRPESGSRAAAARARDRDEALDLVKGLLVIGMLLFHIPSTHPDPAGQAIAGFLYTYVLGFISGSWIFISGFLVGYRAQGLSPPARLDAAERLWGRGLRLIVIFALVNIVLGKLSFSCPDGFFSRDCHPYTLFVLGDNTGMTFEILQGIGYALVFAPLFLWWPRLSIGISAALVAWEGITGLAGLRFEGSDWMLAAGLAGTALGASLRPGVMADIAADPRRRRNAVLIALGVTAVYEAVAIATGVARYNTALYLAGIAAILTLLYLAIGMIRWGGTARAALNLMAQYALVCYMGQMGILVAWNWLVRDVPVLGSLAVAYVVVPLAMLAGIWALDRMRRAMPPVDRLYRLVLG